MIVFALALLLSAPVAAAPDEGGAQCVSDPGCPYSCCRKRTPNSPCYCSACCTAAVPGGSGEVYWSDGRIAILKQRSVEFYRLPKGVTALVGVSSATAKPLEQAVLPRGRLYFRRGAARASVAPAIVRRFTGDLLSPGHASGSRSAFLVCSAVATEFCGGVDLGGKVLFQLPVRSGSPVEPKGLTEDGSEALFALIGAAPRRETIGYVLRQKDGTMREASVDDPDALRLLKIFEGPGVLPEP